MRATKRYVEALLYQSALRRGIMAEKKALNVLKDERLKPRWIVDARKSTSQEERRGIDIVVETEDVGNFLLQIKSSKGGVAAFKSHYGDRADITVIVIKSADTPEVVAKKIFTPLANKHQRMLSELRYCWHYLA